MRMYFRKEGTEVEVYHFFEDNTVLIFSPDQASKQNGNGWRKVKFGQLIPLEYFNKETNGFMSKTERNKIKDKLTLTKALWTCSDGESFEDCDKAIAHEKEVMEKEVDCNVR